MSDLPRRPFGLPAARTHVEQLREEVGSIDERLTRHEGDSRERMARLEEKVDGLAGKVDIVVDLLVEDRRARQDAQTVAAQESGKTERARVSAKTKVMVAFISLISVIAGACATVLAGGCS